MSERRTFRLLGPTILLASVLITLAAAFAQEQPANPFSKEDVVQLLKGSVSPKRIGELAQKRGINFQMTPEVETDLRNAGASNELLATLRVLVPKTATLLIQSTPGGAHVYIDDEPVGTTSSEGRLKLSKLSSGQHQVRLSLDGYHEDAREIALATGAVLELKVNLQPLEAARPTDSDKESAHLPSSETSSTASAKNSLAIVYVYREGHLSCSGINPDIFVDGNSMGKVFDGSYIRLGLTPGSHAVTSTHKGSRLDLNLEEGRTYYVKIHMSGGFPCKGNVALAPEEAAESEIKNLKPRF